MSDDGSVIAGNTRKPKTGDNTICAPGEAASSVGVPTIWKDGKAIALEAELARNPAWVRADRISGDGSTVTGMTNGFGQVAWVDGKLRDIYTEFVCN